MYVLKRLAGKNISNMICLVSSGTLNRNSIKIDILQEDELSEQQIRLGLVEKRLENATKEADDRVDKIQHRLDEANFDLKRKNKYVNKPSRCDLVLIFTAYCN